MVLYYLYVECQGDQGGTYMPASMFRFESHTTMYQGFEAPTTATGKTWRSHVMDRVKLGN